MPRETKEQGEAPNHPSHAVRVLTDAPDSTGQQVHSEVFAAVPPSRNFRRPHARGPFPFNLFSGYPKGSTVLPPFR
jgi:hypothetical protein